MCDWTPTELQAQILCVVLFGLLMLLATLVENRLSREQQEWRAESDRTFDAAMREASARIREWERQQLENWRQDIRVQSERNQAALAFMVRNQERKS